jgi:transposase
MAPVVAALQAMRGSALVVAVTVVAEVGDFRRFANARQLMAYLGLVPSEHSSGASVRRGGITKAGNVLARADRRSLDPGLRVSSRKIGVMVRGCGKLSLSCRSACCESSRSSSR